jgi:predicted phosphodiesterase
MKLTDYGLTEKQLARILAGRRKKPQLINKQFTDDRIRFGVVSDTHLCSIYEKLDELYTFYAILEKEGIDTVLHAGDIVAGQGIYRGQENEIHTFGAKRQAEYVIKKYPQFGNIKTYFITGNHCLSYWKTNGIDIGDLIAEKRSDLIYLGQYAGTMNLGGVIINLLHPDGGTAYALSYRWQKIAEQIPSGQKPNILVGGHFHNAIYFFYRNIHIITGGCFEGQNSFLLRKGINPTIGGWTVDVRIADDNKNSAVAITPSFIPFF